jgi:hypothetical protein
VNAYDVSAVFRPNYNRPDVVEWKGRVKAGNREHAMLMAGIRIAHEHGGLVAESLRTKVTRVKLP